MPRISAFSGSFTPNKRPYVVLTPDAYVSIQGETTVIACGECRRELNLNKYVTGVSTEHAVDAPGGNSATITLSVPDNDINDFFVDGQLLIVPMMEIEVYGKGYYLIGGFPQYYRMFWGLVSSVTKAWSNGTTTITLNCKDILYWWSITQCTINPAFLAPEGGSANNYQLFQNQFAGANPYTIIMALARESMGDFSISTGSLNDSVLPERGKEKRAIGSYMQDIMVYWQQKFNNIWNSLVLYGSSGQAYTFSGMPGNLSPIAITKAIQTAEDKSTNLNQETKNFKIRPKEVAAFKQELSRAGDVEFFQTESKTKLEIAITCRDQIGYEFYCDTTGDIVFKPPFYNLNVIPNKPVSWIYDFEIIEDSITDTEADVFTHITSAGIAFGGGGCDPGLNDEITTPRTGVIDYHLLKRYGWRRQDLSLEWPANATKLLYYILDWIDRINSKRVNGTITIPMRPEIRMGFPVWIPRYDSFFYINGISHQFSPGGQATTTLTLIAKRSKFIAPKNIGKLTKTGVHIALSKDLNGKPTGEKPKIEATYSISFPSDVGATSGNSDQVAAEGGDPAPIRDPKTGKLLGFPNVVMVYRRAIGDQILGRVAAEKGSRTTAPNKAQQDKTKSLGSKYEYNQVIKNSYSMLQSAERSRLVSRLRLHRYEAGASNVGVYDYAHDMSGLDGSGSIKEMSVIPGDSIKWGAGTNAITREDPAHSKVTLEKLKQKIQDQTNIITKGPESLQSILNRALKASKKAVADYNKYITNKYRGKNAAMLNEYQTRDGGTATKEDAEDLKQRAIRNDFINFAKVAQDNLDEAKTELKKLQTEAGDIKSLKSLNIMIKPVSDEFGFEVIGHNRYGRGAFVDRGHVQVLGPNNTTANRINIQFAASGGLLTNNPDINGIDPESLTFSQAFDQMQPEDYVTGASFAGSNYGNKDFKPEQVNFTGQATYSDSINHTIADIGHAVFTEADATRRSLTLAELKPTLSTGLDEAEFNKCACSLGKTNWLSVLPRSFIDKILQPTTAISKGATTGTFSVNQKRDPFSRKATKVVATDFENLNDLSIVETVVARRDIAKEDIKVAAGNSFTLDNPGGFFDQLHDYLTQKFSADYNSNTQREDYDTARRLGLQAPDTLPHQENILPTPEDSLFKRAAQGDQTALKAMKDNVANSNFGISKKAYDEFKEKTKDIGPKLKEAIAPHGSIWNPVTGKLTNQPGTPQTPVQPQIQPGADPTIGNILNPREHSYATPYIDYRDINIGQGKNPP